MLSFILVTLTVRMPAFAQSDSIFKDTHPANSYKTWFDSTKISIEYSYMESTQTHNYSGNWDFDGDYKSDSLYFIGTGGAHLYFYLRIILSSDNKVRNFPFIELDMPLLGSIIDLKKTNFYPPPVLPQFVVDKFPSPSDPYGFIDKIYIHVEEYSLSSSEWKKRRINSSYLLLEYEKGNIVVKDFIK